MVCSGGVVDNREGEPQVPVIRRVATDRNGPTSGPLLDSLGHFGPYLVLLMLRPGSEQGDYNQIISLHCFRPVHLAAGVVVTSDLPMLCMIYLC